MTSTNDKSTSLRTIKARWELSGEGPDEPRRQQLIELGFRLAALVQPGFAPPRTRQEVSSSFETDETWGGYYSSTVYRLGDVARGVEISDRAIDPQDGMTPFETSMDITVYGLPGGWNLRLYGYFPPPVRGVPQEMGLEAKLPEAQARAVEAKLKEEVGAEVE